MTDKVIYEDPTEKGLPPGVDRTTYIFIPLNMPEYYAAENPHTDSEGFLPHDGERKVPAWVEGKLVEAKRYSGFLFEGHDPIEIPWGRVVAYRIVGEQEDQRPELPKRTKTMTDTPVIYENLKYPLPGRTQWVAQDEDGWVWAYSGDSEPYCDHVAGQWYIGYPDGDLVGHVPEYCIPGPWQDSLRRIVRLSDPAYYCAGNPHTDSEGFLPHDGGPMPEWVRGKAVFAIDRNGLPCRGICNWRQIDSYCIVGEQEVTDADGHVGKVHPEDRRREQELSQEQEDVEEGLALLRKHSWDLYEKSGANENGDDPEQFASGNPVPFVEKPRSPSDATYPREAVQRAYEHGLRDGRASRDERYAASLDPSCKPRSPSDASDEQFTADDLQFIFQDGRIGVGISPRTEAGGFQVLKWMPEPQGHTTRHPEARHRNELAARTLTPVPGMDDFMHDVIREARKVRGLDDE